MTSERILELLKEQPIQTRDFLGSFNSTNLSHLAKSINEEIRETRLRDVERVRKLLAANVWFAGNAYIGSRFLEQELDAITKEADGRA